MFAGEFGQYVGHLERGHLHEQLVAIVFDGGDRAVEEPDVVRCELQRDDGAVAEDDRRDGELGAAECGSQYADGRYSGEYM